jgi:hypothetical protein
MFQLGFVIGMVSARVGAVFPVTPAEQWPVANGAFSFVHP